MVLVFVSYRLTRHSLHTCCNYQLDQHVNEQVTLNSKIAKGCIPTGQGAIADGWITMTKCAWPKRLINGFADLEATKASPVLSQVESHLVNMVYPWLMALSAYEYTNSIGCRRFSALNLRVEWLTLGITPLKCLVWVSPCQFPGPIGKIWNFPQTGCRRSSEAAEIWLEGHEKIGHVQI